MPAALTIAGKDVRLRLRDRSAIVLGFVAPVVIAFVMSLAFRNTERFHVNAGLVDLDKGALASGFRSLLAEPQLREVITTKAIATEAEARRSVDDGTVDAALVIPAGFSAAVVSGAPAAIGTLTSVDAAIAGEVAASIARGFVAQVNAERLALATTQRAGGTVDAATIAEATTSLPTAVAVTERAPGGKALKGVSYYGPGMALFFVLFGVSFASRSYVTERREGLVDRMQAAPIRSFEVVLGKALGVAVLGGASLLAMGLVTTLTFGASWGPTIAAVGLGAAMVAAVTALSTFVMVVAHTERQAEGWSGVIVFGLALLGGNFTFLPAAPALMRKLALLTPNGWALRGYTDLATGTSAASAVGPIAAILAFVVVVLAAAALVGARREAAR